MPKLWNSRSFDRRESNESAKSATKTLSQTSKETTKTIVSMQVKNNFHQSSSSSLSLMGTKSVSRSWLPGSKVIWTCDCVIFCAILVSLVCLPFQIFGLVLLPLYLEVSLVVVFVIDILLNFWKAYFDEQGCLCDKTWTPWNSSTARRYLCSASGGDSAACDVVALLGSVNLCLQRESSSRGISPTGTPRDVAFCASGFLCLLRFAKALRFLDFLSCACQIHRMHWEGRVPFQLDLFLCFLLPALYMGHFLACAWISSQGCSMDSEEHQLIEVYLDNLSIALSGLLLGETSIRGCDDITPLPISAVCCARSVCSIVFLSVLMFILMGSRYKPVLTVEQQAIGFLRCHRVSILKCRNYHAQMTMLENKSEVGELVAQAVFMPLLMKVRQFQQLDDLKNDFATTLAVHCNLVPFSPGDIILHEGSLAREMLVVASGTVRYLFHTREGPIHASPNYPENSVMEEIALIYEFERNYAVQGASKGEALIVPGSVVLLLVGMHAPWFEHWAEYVDSLQALLQGDGSPDGAIAAPSCPACNDNPSSNLLYFLNSSSSSQTTTAPERKKVKAGRKAQLWKEDDCGPFCTFLSHSWDLDGSGKLGGDNHHKVVLIHTALAKYGMRCWLDTDGGCTRNISQDICNGIDQSSTFSVFVTKTYLEKVKAGTDNYCGAEFSYACVRLSVKHFIPLILDKECSSQQSWEGPVGFRLGNDLYCDFSNVDWTKSDDDVLQDPDFISKVEEFISLLHARKSTLFDDDKPSKRTFGSISASQGFSNVVTTSSGESSAVKTLDVPLNKMIKATIGASMRSFAAFSGLHRVDEVQDPHSPSAASHLPMGYAPSTTSHSSAASSIWDNHSPFGYSLSENSIAEGSIAPVSYQISLSTDSAVDGDQSPSPMPMRRSFSNMSNLQRVDEGSSLVSRDSVMSEAQAPAMQIAVRSTSSRTSNQSHLPIGYQPSNGATNRPVTPMKLAPGVAQMMKTMSGRHFPAVARDDAKECLS